MKLPRLTFEKDRRRKLTKEELESLSLLREQGMTFQSIADKYEVCIATIYEHVYKERYAEKRKKKIENNKKRYYSDPEYRKRQSIMAVQSKDYKKAVMREVEEKEISRIREKYRKLRERFNIKNV
jgi:predicted DNA-binding protein (UPF0251 family)